VTHAEHVKRAAWVTHEFKSTLLKGWIFREKRGEGRTICCERDGMPEKILRPKKRGKMPA